jgi:hypothetical protein
MALEGYLWKRGSGKSLFGQRSWKLRYIVVDDGSLAYYSDLSHFLSTPSTPLKGRFIPLHRYSFTSKTASEIGVPLTTKSVGGFLLQLVAGEEGDREVLALAVPDASSEDLERWKDGLITNGCEWVVDIVDTPFPQAETEVAPPSSAADEGSSPVSSPIAERLAAEAESAPTVAEPDSATEDESAPTETSIPSEEEVSAQEQGDLPIPPTDAESDEIVNPLQDSVDPGLSKYQLVSVFQRIDSNGGELQAASAFVVQRCMRRCRWRDSRD